MTALRISTDPSELELGLIHRFLAEQSYWARGIERARLERAVAHSLCFGGFIGRAQVAFARVITDYATTAHLKDVFVLPDYRGRGHGVALVQAVVSHPELELLTLSLSTADAHGLYARFGFTAYPEPQRGMVRPGRFFPAVRQPSDDL